MKLLFRLFIWLLVALIGYPVALCIGLVEGLLNGTFWHEFKDVPDATIDLFTDMTRWALGR